MVERFAPLPDGSGDARYPKLTTAVETSDKPPAQGATPEIAEDIALPEPVRVRVLEELAGDAAALREHLRGRGWTEEAAAAEVDAWLGAGPAVWRELEEIHRPIAVRWAERLMRPERNKLEVGLLLAACASLVPAAAAIPLGLDVLRDAPFGTGWTVCALGCVISATALPGILRRHASYDAARLRIIAALSLAAPVTALLGAALAMSVASASSGLLRSVEVATALAAYGLMVGIAGGAVWSIGHASRFTRHSPAQRRGGS